MDKKGTRKVEDTREIDCDLKFIQEVSGVTIAWLAREMGVSTQALYLAQERNRWSPELRNKMRLALTRAMKGMREVKGML